MKIDKTGNGDMGKLLATIEDAVNALPNGIDTSGLTVATANATVGTDGTTAATLANDLKTKFNLLITRLTAAQ